MENRGVITYRCPYLSKSLIFERPLIHLRMKKLHSAETILGTHYTMFNVGPEYVHTREYMWYLMYLSKADLSATFGGRHFVWITCYIRPCSTIHDCNKILQILGNSSPCCMRKWVMFYSKDTPTVSQSQYYYGYDSDLSDKYRSGFLHWHMLTCHWYISNYISKCCRYIVWEGVWVARVNRMLAPFVQLKKNSFDRFWWFSSIIQFRLYSPLWVPKRRALPMSGANFSPNDSWQTPVARLLGWNMDVSILASRSDWCFNFDVVLRATSCYSLRH